MEWCWAYRSDHSQGLVDCRTGGNRAKLSKFHIEELQQKLHQYTSRELFGVNVSTADGQFWTVEYLILSCLVAYWTNTDCATDPGRAKTNFYGALNLHNGQEVAMRSDLMNSEILAQYLELILEVNLNVPSVLLRDRGKSIDKALEEHPRSEIISFPTTSPDLNPQEPVWKAVCKQVSHNHLGTRLPELTDRFLNKLNSSIFKDTFLERCDYTAICPMFN